MPNPKPTIKGKFIVSGKGNLYNPELMHIKGGKARLKPNPASRKSLNKWRSRFTGIGIKKKLGVLAKKIAELEARHSKARISLQEYSEEMHELLLAKQELWFKLKKAEYLKYLKGTK